jgi:hypothetical protein
LALALERMGPASIAVSAASHAVVETLGAIEDVWLGLACALVGSIRFSIGSLFKLRKNDSALALSQQWPRHPCLGLA